MKPLGKISFAQRLVLAMGLAFACVALPAMAQNADVQVGLTLLNESLNLPAPHKPAVTLATASTANLTYITQNLASATGTFQVNGTDVVDSSVPIAGGTTVILPAPNNTGADIGNIMSILSTDAPKTTVDKAAPALLTGAYLGLAATSAPEAADDYADATAASMNASYYIAAGLGAKLDSDEQTILKSYAFGEKAVPAGVTGVLNNPIPVLTESLAVSDTTPTAEALLLSQVANVAQVSDTLQALGAAIKANDSAAITSSYTTGGATFVEDLYNQATVNKDISLADQEAFLEGFTSGETASQLATSATDVANVSAGASAPLKADSVTTLETIAASLILSGSINSDSASATTIGVTEGIENTTAQATPKAIAALATGLIGDLPLSDAGYVSAGAAYVALGGNATVVADILTAKTIGGADGTAALVNSVAQGAAGNSIAYNGGTADQFLTALAGTLSNQKLILPEVVTDLFGFNGFTSPELAGDFASGAPKLDVSIATTLENLDLTNSAPIAYAAGKGVAGTTGTNDKALEALAEGVVADDGSNGVAGTQGVAVSTTIGALVALGDKAALTGDILGGKGGAAIQGFAPQVSEGIGATVTDLIGSIPTDLAAIAAAAAKAVPASLIATATGTEEVALTDGADPVVTGTGFANTFVKNGAAVVGIATTAAQSTSGLASGGSSPGSVTESGSIGVNIDLNKSIYGTISLSSSVATAVAQAATQYIVPGSFEQAVDNNNYSDYTVAAAFGAVGFANPKLAADFPTTTKGTGIGQALGAGVENASGNQAAAAIAYDLAVPFIQAGYSTSNATLVTQIAVGVATADKNAVADIYGYIAEAMYAAGWSTANIELTLYGKSTPHAPTSVTSPGAGSLVAQLETASGAAYNSDIVTANSELSLFDLGTSTSVSYVTADETPIVND